MSQLTVEALRVTYPGGVEALRGVDLDLGPGMFGLLGPNGAGKSTLMRILATLQKPDEGSVVLDAIDVLAEPDRARRILGYLPQDFGFYPRASAEDTLEHLALLKGLRERTRRREVVEGLLARVNLWDVRHRRVGTFSGGMRQRLGIAQALLGDPVLVVVDEPTAGLDPAERHRFHDLLAELSEGRIVVLSTHIVEDVRDLCTGMAVIDRGRILLEGDPQDAVRALRGRVWGTTVAPGEVERHRASGELLSSRLYAGRPVLRVLADAQPDPAFTPEEPNLEDVYFHTLSASAGGDARA